jgi:hypothetical protein
MRSWVVLMVVCISAILLISVIGMQAYIVNKSNEGNELNSTVLPGKMLQITHGKYPVASLASLLDGIRVNIPLSNTSDLILPKNASVLQLSAAKVTQLSICNTRGSNRSYGKDASTSWMLVNPTSTSSTNVSIGVCRSSAFVNVLNLNGFTSWVLINAVGVIDIYPGIPKVPCLNWIWTPMESNTDNYIIKLRASEQYPWQYAIINMGSFESNLPGINADTVVHLTSITGASIVIPPGSYTTEKAVDERVPVSLGISAIAWNSACAVDLGANMFGMSIIKIGQLPSVTTPFLFI